MALAARSKWHVAMNKKCLAATRTVTAGSGQQTNSSTLWSTVNRVTQGHGHRSEGGSI